MLLWIQKLVIVPKLYKRTSPFLGKKQADVIQADVKQVWCKQADGKGHNDVCNLMSK